MRPVGLETCLVSFVCFRLLLLLLLLFVFDVSICTLDGDVHAFADRAVGKVRVGNLFPTQRSSDMIDLNFLATVFQIAIFALKDVKKS